MRARPSGLSGWSATSRALRWSKPMRSWSAVCPNALMGKARPKRFRKNSSSFGVSAASDHSVRPANRTSPGVSSYCPRARGRVRPTSAMRASPIMRSASAMACRVSSTSFCAAATARFPARTSVSDMAPRSKRSWRAAARSFCRSSSRSWAASTGSRVARYLARSRRALAASCSRRASSERTGAAEPARGVCPCDAGGVARMMAERPSTRIGRRAAEELSMASGRQPGEEGQPLRGLLAPDLRDLAIAIVGQTLLVAPEILVEPLDLLVRPGAGEGRAVQDVQLGYLGRVELTRLGNGGFLVVAEGPILDACFLVLLAEALHRELVCALGPVAGHAASVAEGPGTSGTRSGLENPWVGESAEPPPPYPQDVERPVIARAARPARAPRCRARTRGSRPGRSPCAPRAAGAGTRAAPSCPSPANPASDLRRRAPGWQACGRGSPQGAHWAAW